MKLAKEEKISKLKKIQVKGIYKCLNNFASHYIFLMYSSLSNIYFLIALLLNRLLKQQFCKHVTAVFRCGAVYYAVLWRFKRSHNGICFYR